MKKQPKTITLKFTDHLIKGVTDITPWGGGNACIEMKPFHVRDTDKATLLDHINDNGFGVQSINGAICDVYENYEGTIQYVRTITVGKVSKFTLSYYEENL